MHCLSSVYFVNQPLLVSGIFVAPHQEVYCICMYNNWYVLCFFGWLSVSRVGMELRINSASSSFLLRRYIEMHGQQNIKFSKVLVLLIEITVRSTTRVLVLLKVARYSQIGEDIYLQKAAREKDYYQNKFCVILSGE